MQLVLDNLLVNYTEYGSGKNVIFLIHGWADSGQTFEMLAKQLVDDMPGYKAITVDLPGFGATQPPAEPWSLEDYALFCAKFLKKLDVKSKIIIGHSNGGAIAIQGLASKSLKADKLIMIGSAGIRSASFKKSAMRIAAKPLTLYSDLSDIRRKRYGYATGIRQNLRSSNATRTFACNTNGRTFCASRTSP